MTSTGTIAVLHIVGATVPISPYFLLLPHLPTVALDSVKVTVAALLVFGYIKGRFTGSVPMRSALRRYWSGVATGVAFGPARLIG